MSSTTQQWVWTSDVYNPDSSVGTWAWTASTPQVDGGYFSNGGSAAQGDYLQFNNVLQLDGNVTLKFVLACIQSTANYGIATLQTSPDGTTWTDQATVDTYGAGGNNAILTSSTWTMTAGVYHVRICCKTKNASSTAYILRMNQFTIMRTA